MRLWLSMCYHWLICKVSIDLYMHTKTQTQKLMVWPFLTSHHHFISSHEILHGSYSKQQINGIGQRGVRAADCTTAKKRKYDYIPLQSCLICTSVLVKFEIVHFLYYFQLCVWAPHVESHEKSLTVTPTDWASHFSVFGFSNVVLRFSLKSDTN